MNVFITGGRSWIGQALALDRALRGDRVWLTASTDASKLDLEGTCLARGLRASCVVFDLLRPAEAPADCRAALTQADALILNAATRVVTFGPFHTVPAAEVDAAVAANVNGNLWLLRETLAGMVDRRFGRIVFVSSVSAAMGTSGYGAYCLTKAAMEGLIRNLAVDYAAQGVLANSVRLGVFRTPRTEAFWSRPSYVRRAESLIPQGALGDVAAIAEAVHPLLSATQYINGTEITVAGGLPLVRLPSTTTGRD